MKKLATRYLDKAYISLLLILILAAFLRFHRLSEMVTFDYDQEFAANFAYSVLREFPIRLIGQGLSVQGLFGGPLYSYFLVPFFAASNLHPIGGFVGSVLFGLVIVAAYFFVAKDLFGMPAGLIAAFLRSVFYTGLEHDWNMNSAYHSELLVLVTWWAFYRYWKGSTNALPLLGLAFGLYTSIHPILFPLYFVFLILFLIKRFLPSVKIALLSLILFLIPLAPLILFEYWHKFLEVKNLLSFFTNPSAQSMDLGRLISNFKIILVEPARILGIPFIAKEPLFALLLFISLLSVTLLLIVKRVGFWQNSFHKIMLLVTFLVFLLYYTFLPAHITEYYFLALGTLIFLYISAILGLLTRTRPLLIILFLVLITVTVTNLRHLVYFKWRSPYLVTLSHKDFIVKEIVRRQPKDQEFYLSYISNPGWNFGFSYLFKYYGREPQTREVKPPVYTIVIPKDLSPGSIDISSGNIGLILPD